MNSRRYPSHPIPGVGAVVVSRRGILLVRRDKEPGTGLWSLPGGAVELGETQEDAVAREVKEETGVDCQVIGLLTTADLISADSSGRTEYHFLLNHYLARAMSEDAVPETPHGEVGWFHLGNLPGDMASNLVTDLILAARERILAVMEPDDKKDR